MDGILIATVEWKGGEAGKFYDLEYVIPAGIIEGKSTVNVRVEANYDRTAGRIFGCRTIKK